jgi:DNA-binding transcriptional LysR family regulator
METFIYGKNVSVQKKIELTSNEALKQAVIAGLGYSIMPLLGIKETVDVGDIKIIKHAGLPIHTQWNIVWLKNKSLSLVATAFIEYLSTEKDTIKAKYFDWVEE